MPKTRKKIPQAVREAVLKEFNHLCAACGKPSPQLHHIDGDTTNCSPMNLMPLCPNDHLIDVHNPTKPIDYRKLQLLRCFKDPTVLEPQFEPLFRRMYFILDIERAPFDAGKADKAVRELIQFVGNLNMGQFYSKKLKHLISPPSYLLALSLNASLGSETDAALAEYRAKFQDMLLRSKDEVVALLVELLQYQNWSSGKGKTAQ